MAFDKTSAMRNAERYLAQGKIRSAITEYRSVVQNDPKDFVTMNMLGDLCVKDGDHKQALKCYNSVAEHYGKQGFAAKAIAVYNKITKLSAYSPDIEEKLAELHKMKGSVSEARVHYTSLAEHYERNGKKLESLGTWKKIAYLDTNNTVVLQKLGTSYQEEGYPEEAIESFNALGDRFIAQSKFAEAVEAFERSLAIDERNGAALIGFTESKKALGRAEDAVERLESLAAEGSFDHDVAKLLFECYLAASNAAEAERVLLRLVEFEPGVYPSFLQLGRLYLSLGDATSAARSLSLSSEHLLVAGNGSDVMELASEILNEIPDQIEALRVLCDFHTWQRDEPSLFAALKQLAAAANEAEAVHEERFALSQLVMIAPQETGFAERLRELNEQNGFETEEVSVNGFDAHFAKISSNGAEASVPFETVPVMVEYEFDELTAHDVTGNVAGWTEAEDSAFANSEPGETINPAGSETESKEPAGSTEPSGDAKLAKEIESIRFYVDNGYTELAQKAADELRQEFGIRTEITDLYSYIKGERSDETPEIAQSHIGEESIEQAQPTTAAEFEATTTVVASSENSENNSGAFDLSDLRSELGFEEEAEDRSADFETHYNTAIAYQEMGMLETAINEFQSAVGLVSQTDGTRRFFQCSNMLGHCFMQIGRPNLALTWYQRTLETPGLNDDEKQALWYELASAYEADGDPASAAKFFEKVYAENINFRDVGERLKTIAVPA